MNTSNSELLFALVVGVAYFCYQILQEIKEMKQEFTEMKKVMEWNSSSRLCKDFNRRLDLHYSKIYKMNARMFHKIIDRNVNHVNADDGSSSSVEGDDTPVDPPVVFRDVPPIPPPPQSVADFPLRTDEHDLVGDKNDEDDKNDTNEKI